MGITNHKSQSGAARRSGDNHFSRILLPCSFHLEKSHVRQ